MGIPGNAALCDIILCGDWPDHCSSPEHLVSDSVIPDFTLNPSSYQCCSESFGVMLFVMPNNCYHIYITIGLMESFIHICCNLTVVFFSHIPRRHLYAFTSHPPVACVVDTKYLNELVHGIRFPAKPAGLKYYVGIMSRPTNCLSFPPPHLSSCCSTSNVNYCHLFLILS